MASFLKVMQIKSLIAQPKKIKKVMRSGLGLRKIGVEKEFADNNCIRGMVNKVKHLVNCDIITK